MFSIPADSNTAQVTPPQTGLETNVSFPIAIDSTAVDHQPQTLRPNKYVHPLFDGYVGERYLKKLLEQILPYALFRTWSHAVNFQAPGNVCYVGTSKLAEQTKPGVRKIEIDLLELESRGLMRKYTDRIAVPQENGTFLYRAIIVKDFTPLYDFAYGYHLWINSPEYVPASRDYEDFFIIHPQLCEALMKYDNYRRIFTCQKPGRKPMEKSQPVAYQYSQINQPQEVGESGTEDLNPNNYLIVSGNNYSAYREPKKEEISLLNNSFSTSDLEGGVLESLAIRNDWNVQQSETEESIIYPKNTTENREKVIQTEIPSKSNQSNNPTENEISAGNAKEEKEYTFADLKQNPFAMAAFLVEMQGNAVLERGQQQPSAHQKLKSAKSKSEKRKRRGTPEQLAQYISYIVQQLGDNPKSHQSDVTRVTKIYYAATQIFSGFRNDWFLDQLREAFIVTMKARKVKLRVPYFFTCLENLLELTLEEKAFIRSSEPLYQDGDIKDFIAQIQRTYEKSNSDLNYETWIQRNYLTIGSTNPMKPIV